MVTRIPRLTIQISAQIQFEIMNFMSNLLYLNSCDNYPNKYPHNCFRLIFKLLLRRQATGLLQAFWSARAPLYSSQACLQELFTTLFLLVFPSIDSSIFYFFATKVPPKLNRRWIRQAKRKITIALKIVALVKSERT